MTLALTSDRALLTPTLRLSGFLMLLSTQDIVPIVALCLVLIGLSIVVFHKIDLVTVRVTWPILIVVIIGSFSAVQSVDFDAWAYSRDVIYVAKIPVIVMAAVLLCGKDCGEADLVRAVLWSAGILALVYIAEYYAAGGAGLTRRELRLEVGRGYLLWSIAAFLLISHRCFLPNTVWMRLGAKLVLGLVLFHATQISTSRTLPLMVVIFVAIWLGVRSIAAMKVVMAVILVCVVVFTFPPLYGAIGQTALSIGSPVVVENIQEMISLEFGSREQIQANFRSYEAVQAWTLFQTMPTFQLVFGAGFGTQIPLDTHVSLGITQTDQQVYQAVPISHISGMSVLVKCGWVGVALYFYSVYPLLSMARHARPVLRSMNWALGVIYLYLNLVFQGIFSNLDLTMITVVLLALTKRIVERSADPLGTVDRDA